MESGLLQAGPAIEPLQPAQSDPLHWGEHLRPGRPPDLAPAGGVVPGMNDYSSGIGMVATAAWWTTRTNGIENALQSAGMLTDEARAGFDELDAVASQGLRLGIELAKGELLGSFIDRLA